MNIVIDSKTKGNYDIHLNNIIANISDESIFHNEEYKLDRPLNIYYFK